jgi:hypothetical protein
MTAWTGKEIGRFLFREGLFRRRGMSAADAERVADRLAGRDQDRDDRRICAECAHFQQSRTCFKQLPTSFIQLIRCEGFAWQKP